MSAQDPRPARRAAHLALPAASLETGPLQPEAVAPYTDRGQRRILFHGRYPEALAFRFDLCWASPGREL